MALTEEEQRQKDIEEEFSRLRKYLNTAIKGEVTDALLYSMAAMGRYLIHNVQAVDEQLYIVSAVDRYLDLKLSGYNIVRPTQVGLSDEIFRELGIEVKNRAQVRDLIHKILNTMYGDDFTNASIKANELEPYDLEDGDNLIIALDGQDNFQISFDADDFVDISNATAQEVADSITRSIRSLDLKGKAVVKDDGLGPYVEIFSETLGPSSTVKILGGKAQNELRFDLIRPTTGDATTQWTIEQQPSGNMRATWTGGVNPGVGKAKKNDYANIYGTSFDEDNRGTFTITEVQGGTIGNAYFEFENPFGVDEIVVQGTDDAVLFFNSERKTLNSKIRFAAGYQTETRTFEIYLPATTRVVRRDRAGAAHLYGPTSPVNDGEQNGPYIYDLTKAYTVGDVSTETTEEENTGSDNILSVSDSSEFPDESGNIVIGYGTSHEEGPIPYISRPSDASILISPAYTFKNTHPAGSDVSYIIQNSPYIPAKDGSDFPFYITDSVSGRIYAEELIASVAATGINVIINILYPDDIGLGKHGTVFSEREYVWGEDDWPKELQVNRDS